MTRSGACSVHLRAGPARQSLGALQLHVGADRKLSQFVGGSTLFGADTLLHLIPGEPWTCGIRQSKSLIAAQLNNLSGVEIVNAAANAYCQWQVWARATPD